MMRNGWGAWVRFVSVVLWSLVIGLSTPLVHAREAYEVPAQSILMTRLPAEGQAVMTLIYRGGPFQYDRDGTVFFNRERLLPVKSRGYYREYTVRTPGERSRGARRIVCGGQRPTAPDACFYTDDHYASFRQIVW
jgi:ribonuclease T1